MDPSERNRREPATVSAVACPLFREFFLALLLSWTKCPTISVVWDTSWKITRGMLLPPSDTDTEGAPTERTRSSLTDLMKETCPSPASPMMAPHTPPSLGWKLTPAGMGEIGAGEAGPHHLALNELSSAVARKRTPPVMTDPMMLITRTSLE